MNRLLQYFNLAGVIALGVLCVLQWRANRNCNLDQIAFQKTARELSAKTSEQAKTIDGLKADLEDFRQQVSRTTGSFKEADAKLRKLERDNAALYSERDQLKSSVTAWSEAITARDVKIREANKTIEQIAAERDQVIGKFNQLAEKHNTVVKNLNDALAQLALVQTNAPTQKQTKTP
jgi:uncharacterized coiled-coil DUF342 family protein